MTDGMERHAGIALWRQIAERIRGEIAEGLHRPGERLPPETDLSARFGVNRHTLRRAMAVLAAEGIVRVDQGRGTFVETGRLAYPIARRTRFSEILAAQAREAAGRMTGQACERANAWVAEALGLPEGADVFRIEAVSDADGIPMSLSTHWIPAERFPRAPEVYRETGSFTRVMEAHGVTDYTRRSTRVRARTADPGEAATLGITLGGVLMVTENVDVDADGRPVQVSRTRFRADRIELVFETG